MTDVELGTFDSPKAQLILNTQESVNDLVEEKVVSRHGHSVYVYIIGDRKRPPMITFHDLGLNANSCFQSFFQFSEMSVIADRFCIYQINAPGQEEDAECFSDTFIYPSMYELTEIVEDVVSHFTLKNFIGFGVGAGANVLCRYALKHASNIEALILINCTSMAAGWVEWGYQKANIYYLRNRGITNLTVDYLMWHHFGRNLDQYNPDLVLSYKQYFSQIPNPKNLAGFIESYINRTDLGVQREGPTLQCSVLQIVGAGSPHINESVDLNSKLNPSNSNWLKMSDCSGIVLEEKPEKVAEAVLLFLQGLGHLPSMNHLKWREQASQSRSNSVTSGTYPFIPRSHSLQPPVASLHHEGADGNECIEVSAVRSKSIAVPNLGDGATLVHRPTSGEHETSLTVDA